ncbi:diguanylate cyclase [Salinisphaera sp. T31B1]|uniref:diguanylate cyclase n=1 Tax=Salinisphaera sp. T31B1 TaxID=727963 RepID=UPI00333FDEC3
MDHIASRVIERHGLGGTWWYDLETRQLWWSEGIYRIHDIEPEAYTPSPETVGQFYEPESRARVREAIDRAVHEHIGWSLTLLLRRRNGELRYVHSVAGVEVRSGKAPLLAGAFFDIHAPTVERIERETRRHRQSEQQSRRWRIAGENAGLALIDFDSQIYRVSGAFARHIGLSDGGEVEIDAEQWLAFVHPEDRLVRHRRLLAHLAGESAFYVCEYRLRLGGDQDLWVREAGRRAAEDEDVGGDRMIGTLSDITDRKLAERAVFDAKELAEVTFEAIGEGLIRVDREGRISEINSAGCALLARDAASTIGQRFVDVVQLYEAARDRLLPDPVAEVIEHGERVRVPIFSRLRRADGAFLAIVDSVSPIHDEAGAVRGVVFVFQDISEARRMTEELVHQASHDPLTGLLNRRGFEEALERAWHQVNAGQRKACVMYLDLDHFKTINDRFGHAIGDALLREVAEAFRQILRSSDVLARLGGDEFAAIVESAAPEDVDTIARKLIKAARKIHVKACRRTLPLGVSLGVAVIEPGLISGEAALNKADIALYRAKTAGRGRYQFHDDSAVDSPWADNQLDGRMRK